MASSMQAGRQDSEDPAKASTLVGMTEGLDVDDEATAAAKDGADPSEPSKLRTFLSILRKMVGKEMSSVRLSLPAQLLAPIPNLEYWQYTDRPDFFAAIGEPDDPIERMLRACAWMCSKELKFVDGKLCKPFNSILGEHFRCSWEVEMPMTGQDGAIVPTQALQGDGSANGAAGDTSTPLAKTSKLPSLPRVSTSSRASIKSLSTTDESEQQQQPRRKARVAALVEQVSHHPPISAYYYTSPETGVEARGMDQIAAKYTGMSIRVYSGEYNKGIFLELGKKWTRTLPDGRRVKERYHLTHPTAAIQGFLRGSPYAVVCDSSIVRCEDTKLKAILEYKEERWLGKPRFLFEGVIYSYDPLNDDTFTTVKAVPSDRVAATLTGCWQGEIKFVKGKGKPTTLLDLSKLVTIPKKIRPLAQQEPMESRKVWEPVMKGITSKQFTKATDAKVVIEDRQRAAAAERKKKGETFTPLFFNPIEQMGDDGEDEYENGAKKSLYATTLGDGHHTRAGYPVLTPLGEKAIDDELKRPLEGSLEGILIKT